MKAYKKNYLKYFNYKENDQVISEITGSIAHDIHHIDARGMGGSHGEEALKKDHPSNLIALTRTEHDIVEDNNVYYKEWLKMIHRLFEAYSMSYNEIYRTTKLSDPTHVDPIYEEFLNKLKSKLR